MEETKQLIFQEINAAPDEVFLAEVLHYVRFLKEQYQMELEADSQSAAIDLEAAQSEGTKPWEQVKQELGL